MFINRKGNLIMNWNQVLASSIFVSLLPISAMFPSASVEAAGLLDEWVVGQAPVAQALNPVTNKVYVANSGDASVSVANPTTGTVIRVGVGMTPVGVAINPVTNKIYVANSGDNSVSVIDGATNSVTRVIVGTRPRALAVNEVTNKIYVANNGNNSVSVINGANNAVTAVTVGTSPTALALNVSTNKVYVANSGSASASVIDGATNQVAMVSVGANPVSVAVNAVTNKIYVANQGANNVSRIDGTNNTVTAAIVGRGPVAVTVDPASNVVYVANNVDGSISVLDETAHTNSSRPSGGHNPVALAVMGAGNVAVAHTDNVTVLGPNNASYTFPATYAGKGASALTYSPITAKLFAISPTAKVLRMLDPNLPGLGSIPLTARAFSPFGAAINPVTNNIYAADETDSLHVIDGVTGAVTSLSVGRVGKPAINPITNTAYASSRACEQFTAGALAVINGTTLAASIPLGHCPARAKVNPVTNRIYVGNKLDNTVTVIDGAKNSVLATLPVGRNPTTIAINQATNMVYVANYYDNTISVINGATHALAAVTVCAQPLFIAIDSRANLAYVLGQQGDLSVIDGGNKVSTVAVPTVGRNLADEFIAINEITGDAYVVVTETVNASNYASLYVYHGTSLIRANSETQNLRAALALNPATNQLYIPNGKDGNVTLLDGATFNRSSIVSRVNPTLPLINPLDNRAYALNLGGTDAMGNVIAPSVTTIKPTDATAARATIAITPLAGSRTTSTTPTFTITPINPLPTNALPVRQVHYQVDTQTGSWLRATPNGTNWQASLFGVANGVHVLYAFAGDGDEANAANTGPNGSPLAAKVVAYLFVKS